MFKRDRFEKTSADQETEPPLELIERGRKPDLKSIMRLYIAVFLLLLIFGSLLQNLHFELGMIFTQLLIILLPALWYWRRYRVDQVGFARLRSLQLRYIPIIILLSGSFWLLNMVIAAGLITGLMELGFEPVIVLEPPQSFLEYLGYLAVLSIAAGICEEVLFRGTIMPAMEENGLVPAVVLSSLLFALFHGSLISLLSTFMLGAVIAVIVIKTGSLWGGILYHMLNNFYAATYLYLLQVFGLHETAGGLEPAAELDGGGLVVALPLLALALVGAFMGLRLLQNNSDVEPLLNNRRGWLPRGWLNWPFILGVILFLLMAMLEMAIGFGWFPHGWELGGAALCININ